MNIHIQQAVYGNAKGVMHVMRESWLTTYPNKDVGITLEDILEYTKNHFDKEELEKRNSYYKKLSEQNFEDTPFPKRKVLVVEDAEKKLIIGTAVLTFHEDKNQLQAIYLLPEYQGQGIGTLLWQEILKDFNNSKDTIVELAVYNEQAKTFYAKLGFVDTGERFTHERHRMPVSGVVIPEMRMILKNPKI